MTPIVIDLYGKIYLGSYECVDQQTVRVSSVGLGSKMAQMSGSGAESIAHKLLRELVRESRARTQMIEREHTI
jgi:hypothetical protein